MEKQAILQFRGQVATGLQVTLNIRDEQGQEITETCGTLPAAPELVESLERWRDSYRQLVTFSRLSPIKVVVRPGILSQQASCHHLGQQLLEHFHHWLNAPEFLAIDRRLRETFNHQDRFRVLVRSDESLLHRLPWHRWDLIENYPSAEVIFGSIPQRVTFPPNAKTTKKVRILAILGDRRHINTDVDRQLLEELPYAEVTFFVEPSRQEMDAQLWRQPWDILFFAGHSSSDNHQGIIYLNPRESLTIRELRYALRRAIRRGLQLAIFNSCDGLGLAYALESLHLPQLIVMREPVADRVAQDFLKHFLMAFSRGEQLHLALREARERLQSLEGDYPWATWLPVLFQNPAAIAPTWQSLRERPGQSQSRQSWLRATALGTGLALALLAGRYYGGMQTVELALLDHFMRSRASELEDDRIVVVEVTDDDIANMPPAERRTSKQGQARSISNQTLDQVFKKLDTYDPTVIGLDIYRDLPSELDDLKQQYADNDRLLVVCKGADSKRGLTGIAPPEEVPPERLALSDTLGDADGVLRRQLLSSQPQPNSPCATDYSLSAALAYSYLAAQGILLEFPNEQTWQWGQTRLRRIGGLPGLNLRRTYARYGPYAPLNVQGHQLLLNYRVHQFEPGQPKDPAQAFLRVTLGELLDNQLSPESLRDKIVLIGVNASHSDDYWQTPYRTATGEPLEVAGVHIQAQMTSQLISAVLDGRSILHCLPWLIEGMVMLGLGATAAVWVRGRWGWVGFVLAPFGLYGLCRIVFISTGLCLPLFPWSLALIGGSIVSHLDKRLSHRGGRFSNWLIPYSS